MKCVFAPFDCSVPSAYETDIIDSQTLAQFCQACPIIKAIPKEAWFTWIEAMLPPKEEKQE